MKLGEYYLKGDCNFESWNASDLNRFLAGRLIEGLGDRHSERHSERHSGLRHSDDPGDKLESLGDGFDWWSSPSDVWFVCSKLGKRLGSCDFRLFLCLFGLCSKPLRSGAGQINGIFVVRTWKIKKKKLWNFRLFRCLFGKNDNFCEISLSFLYFNWYFVE